MACPILSSMISCVGDVCSAIQFRWCIDVRFSRPFASCMSLACLSRSDTPFQARKKSHSCCPSFKKSVCRSSRVCEWRRIPADRSQKPQRHARAHAPSSSTPPEHDHSRTRLPVTQCECVEKFLLQSARRPPHATLSAPLYTALVAVLTERHEHCSCT